MKAIFGGSSAGPVQAARNPAAGKVPQPGAPAFSDHLQDPPEKTLAEKKADGEVVTIAPVPKPKLHLYISADLIGRVIRGHENEIATPEDIAELKRLQEIDDRFTSLIAQNTDASAKEDWKRQRSELQTHALSGELSKLPQNSWTLDDFRQDKYQNRKEFKNGRRENRLKTRIIINRIHPRIGALAKSEADKIEQVEIATAKEWGLAFEPSDVLQRVRYLSEHAETIFPECGANPPKTALSCIGITITNDK